MTPNFENDFAPSGFMPHGMCYLWQPQILALHVASDSLIALAYFSIPFTLFYFAQKRADLQLNTTLLSFAAFIIACGTTHVMEVWNVWFPAYWLSGGIKALTALISVPTAVLLFKLVPAGLSVPSPAALQAVNAELRRQMSERERAEHDLREATVLLEQKVAGRNAELHAANIQLRHEIQEREKADALLNGILRSICDGVIVTDDNGRITYANAAASRLFGGKSKDLLDRPFRALIQTIGNADLISLGAETDLAASQIRPVRKLSDALLTTSTGAEISIDLFESPIQASTASHHTVFTFRDSSARKRSEIELRKSTERFSLAANAAGIGFWEFDVSSSTLVWDKKMARLYGRENIEGRPQPYSLWTESLHPDDRDDAEQAVRDAAGGTRPHHFEFRIVRPDGSIRHLRASAVMTRDNEGNVQHMFGLNFDITDRKHAADQLRLTIEAAPTGMIMTNTAGVIELVNAEIEKIFGYSRAELLGKPIEILLPERFRAHHPSLRAGFYTMQQARKMGAGRDLYGLRRDGSEVPIEIGLNPLDTAEGHFILSSVADITERKRGVETLHKLNAELEKQIATRTSQLKEREVLLQEIHHRVKNNLQVISSLINMQVRTIDSPAGKTVLNQCRSRVQAMAQIHEMLYESRNYASVPFAEYARLLANRVLLASDLTPSAVAIEFALQDLSLPVDKAIPCALILNELIANALKHAFKDTTEKGVVRVQLQSTAGHEAILSVSDNGIGIPANLRIDQLRSVGMQVITTLVTQLDGQLEIVRESGSTFRVTFPLEPSP